MKETQSFVLQSVDPVSAVASSEARVRIRVRDLKHLASILELPEVGDPLLAGCFHLTKKQLAKIGALCEPPFDPDQSLTVLRSWQSIRELPYLVHTDYELPLMLEGRKPLAYFYDQRSWLNEYLAPFEPYVTTGELVRQVIDDPKNGSGGNVDCLSRVYIALPSEIWRIEAHKLLRAVSAKTGWNESMERFEGSLLGYEDWQNDCWIEFRRQRQHS